MEAAPVHVQIEVTWRCNWRCVHCYQDTHAPKGPSTEQLVDLVKQLAASGTLHVIITGGEPLMRRDLIQILSVIHSYDIGITLYTNGHLVNNEMSHSLSGLIAAAELSILSGDDRVHDDLARVRGAANKAWHAATSLQAQGVAVTIKTPLMRPALGTFALLARKCARAGMAWHPDSDITGSYGGDVYPLQYRLNDDELTEFYRDFPSFAPQFGYTTDPGIKDGICLAGRRYCFIDVEGNVFPCLNFKAPSDAWQRKGAPSPVSMGNAFRDSFADIWNSAIGREIRSKSGRDFQRCATCSGACNPCMAKNFESTGELFNMRGSCYSNANDPLMIGMPSVQSRG